MTDKEKVSKGSYALFIQLDSERKIKVGSLGTFTFSPGVYCYVGSGMNNLDKRVERHISKDKTKHWHIDYFLEESEVIATVKLRTEADKECELNEVFSKLAEETPVKGFGSSDCNCRAHFHLMKEDNKNQL